MNLVAQIERQSKALILLEATLTALLIGVGDFFTGYEVSLALFYGVPIMFAVWFCDRKSGLLLAILSGIIWWWADIFSGHPYPKFWISIWEPAAHFVYFGFVAIGGAGLKERHNAVEARIALLEHSQKLEREIIEISEREQRRIGRDLHDGLCQFLAAIGCAAGSLRGDLLRQGLAKEASLAEELTELLQDGVVQTRDLARGLVPISLDEAGLPIALDGLANSVTRLQNVDCKVEASDDVRISDPSAATHLYRIAQEAINNATRHGRAGRILIALSSEGDQASLSVTDNGRGISPRMADSGGLGLSIMTYRARLVHGHLTIGAARGGGTVITCTFPQPALPNETQHAAA